jgi:hypothetical protein
MISGRVVRKSEFVGVFWGIHFSSHIYVVKESKAPPDCSKATHIWMDMIVCLKWGLNWMSHFSHIVIHSKSSVVSIVYPLKETIITASISILRIHQLKCQRKVFCGLSLNIGKVISNGRNLVILFSNWSIGSDCFGMRHIWLILERVSNCGTNLNELLDKAVTNFSFWDDRNKCSEIERCPNASYLLNTQIHLFLLWPRNSKIHYIGKLNEGRRNVKLNLSEERTGQSFEKKASNVPLFDEIIIEIEWQ